MLIWKVIELAEDSSKPTWAQSRMVFGKTNKKATFCICVIRLQHCYFGQVKILLRNPFDLKSKKRIFNTNSFPKNHWTSIKISSTLRKKRSTKSFRTSKLEINENSQQEKTDQRTFCYERNYISLVFQDICVSRDFLIIWCQNRNKKRKY